MSEYRVLYFVDPDTGDIPVKNYVRELNVKDRSKVRKYITFLKDSKGVLDEPYTKHIRDKLRELRVDFSKRRHRIFFFTSIGQNIVLLHAFLKKTEKNPESEIIRATNNYYKFITNKDAYEIY